MLILNIISLGIIVSFVFLVCIVLFMDLIIYLEIVLKGFIVLWEKYNKVFQIKNVSLVIFVLKEVDFIIYVLLGFISYILDRNFVIYVQLEVIVILMK